MRLKMENFSEQIIYRFFNRNSFKQTIVMPLNERSLLKDINKALKSSLTSLLFKEGNATLINEQNVETEKYNNTLHSSIKVTSNKLFLKDIENYVLEIFQTKLSKQYQSSKY